MGFGAGGEGLFVEAEALGFVEVFRGLLRRDVVGRDAGDGGAGKVAGDVKGGMLLAERQGDGRLGRLEPPRHAAVDVGVEAHGDHPAAGAGGGGWADLRRAPVAGGGTEQAVERHRGEGQAAHRDDDAE